MIIKQNIIIIREEDKEEESFFIINNNLEPGAVQQPLLRGRREEQGAERGACTRFSIGFIDDEGPSWTKKV